MKEMHQGLNAMILSESLSKQKFCIADVVRLMPKGAPKYLCILLSLAIEQPVRVIQLEMESMAIGVITKFAYSIFPLRPLHSDKDMP
jgi:hypothetical protein